RRLDLYRREGFEFLPSGKFAGDLSARAGRARRFVSSMMQWGRIRDPVAATGSAWTHFAECILSSKQTRCPLIEGVRAMEIYADAMKVLNEARPAEPRPGLGNAR